MGFAVINPSYARYPLDWGGDVTNLNAVGER